jgi:hypothetical protein
MKLFGITLCNHTGPFSLRVICGCKMNYTGEKGFFLLFVKFMGQGCAPRLIAQVYEVNPLECPRCHSPMTVIAVITDLEKVRRILLHPVEIGLPSLNRQSVSLVYPGGGTRCSSFGNLFTEEHLSELYGLPIRTAIHEGRRKVIY